MPGDHIDVDISSVNDQSRSECGVRVHDEYFGCPGGRQRSGQGHIIYDTLNPKKLREFHMVVDSVSELTRSSVAEALRNLGHRFVEHELDDQALQQILESTRDLTESVCMAPKRSRSTSDLADEIPADPPLDGADMDHYSSCPVSGKENPIGLAARVKRDGGDVVATVTFESACAGMPGFAHGGPVAAVFDDVMGFVLSSMNGLSGYTATMTVNYKAPVKVGLEVEYRGRLTRRDGRKLSIEAEASAEGVRLATAHALFVEVDIASIERKLRA